MNLKINNRVLKFELIPLSFEQKNIENIFYKKNNKTLKQTFDHPRYSSLKILFSKKYENHLEMKLGDFLKHLKESKDINYKCFLNKYGDNKFCKFSIQSYLDQKGIYCYILNNQVKYVGRCVDNFKKRINQGYGSIHPKNCFRDGQATNCHLNSKINLSKNVQFGVFIMKNETPSEIKELEKLILTCNKYDWNIQAS
jgi:hypothetical protein